MPTSKNHRNSNAHLETHRRRKLAERSSSFHAHNAAAGTTSGGQLRRPKTVPDLVSDRSRAVSEVAPPRQPPRLLVKVAVMGSLAPVQVVMMPESSVGDLVGTAVRQYVKEGRRPILPSTDPCHFHLHYSQFSLESLDRVEKVRELGSRNFFLCPTPTQSTVTLGGGVSRDSTSTTSFASCSEEAEKPSKGGWLRFMDFLK